MRFVTIRRSRKDPTVEGIECDSTHTIIPYVACGELKVPVTRLGTHEFAVSHEDGPCFGDPGYVTATQYRVLVAEIIAKVSHVPLESIRYCCETGTYGLYTQILNIINRLPHINGVSRPYVKDRATSAAFEGLLTGLARWDATKARSEDKIEDLFSHVSLWMRRYVSHELVVLRGEGSGFIREAELTQREYFGSSYSKLRSAARAYGDVWSLSNPRPSVSDVLNELDGKKVTKTSVKRYIASLYGSQCLVNDRMPDQLTSDIRSVYRAIRSDAPKLMSSTIGFNHDVLESFDILYKLRSQLFHALAEHKSAISVLTPIRCEIIDVMFFYPLALNSDYDVYIGTTIDRLDMNSIRKFIRTCDNDYYRMKALSRLFHLDDNKPTSYIKIPDLSSRGSKSSALCGVNAPTHFDGSFDSDVVDHLGGIFHRRSFSSRVALRVASRHADPVGPENVTLKEYRDILDNVIFIRKVIKQRGYLDPLSKNVLPVIKEFYYLDAGYTIAGQRSLCGDQIFVRKSDGSVLPMVSWVPPALHSREILPHRVHHKVNVGWVIEYTRQQSILREKCNTLMSSGKMEKRLVYVKCSKSDPKAIPIKTSRVFGGKKSQVTRYYRLEERILPVSLKIGDIVRM